MPYMDPTGVLPSFLKDVLSTYGRQKGIPYHLGVGDDDNATSFSSSDLYKTSKHNFWSETDLESKIHLEHIHNWLVVSTHLKNVRQNGNLPQIGMKIKNIWNHHLDNQQVVIDYHRSKGRFSMMKKMVTRTLTRLSVRWLTIAQTPGMAGCGRV